MWIPLISFQTYINRRWSRVLSSSPSHPQTAYLRMGTPSSFSGDLPSLAHGRGCVYSVGTVFLCQETRSCLNDSSYGKTICLRPAPKCGLCVVAGAASAKWAGPWEMRTATRPDNRVAPALALPLPGHASQLKRLVCRAIFSGSKSTSFVWHSQQVGYRVVLACYGLNSVLRFPRNTFFPRQHILFPFPGQL